MQQTSAGEETRLLDHVAALEKLHGAARGRELQSRLAAQGTSAKIRAWPVPRIENLVVDFSPRPNERHLLFSAHYDAVKKSPGANDNASSVAVLLEICRRLRGASVPVKIVFFDQEEAWFRTPFIRLGLLGSFHYALSNDLGKIEAVFNLEFCGVGDSLGIWPVKSSNRGILAVEVAEKAAGTLKTHVTIGSVPGVLLSSDHLPFRLGGVSNSITLSLLPSDQLPVLENFMGNLSIPRLLGGQRPSMPGVLERVHKANDVSSRLSEDSLRLMVSLLLQIIHIYPFAKTRA